MLSDVINHLKKHSNENCVINMFFFLMMKDAYKEN